MARVVLAVAEGALAVLPRLAPVDGGESDEERARGQAACEKRIELGWAVGAALERVAARRVMEKSRRFAQLRNAIDEEIALGGMQVAARRIHAQRPARAARLLPRRERERVLEKARQRVQVERRARHRAGRVKAVVRRRAGLVVRREERQPRERRALEAAEGI